MNGLFQRAGTRAADAALALLDGIAAAAGLLARAAAAALCFVLDTLADMARPDSGPLAATLRALGEAAALAVFLLGLAGMALVVG